MRMADNIAAKHNKYLDIDTLAYAVLKNPSTLSSKTAQLVEQLADAIDCIKKISPDKYFEHYIHFHKLLYGNFFTEDLYDYATSLMENIDGSKGAILTKDRLKEEARKCGLIANSIMNDWDIFYIATMYMSDNWDKTLPDEDNIAFAFKATKGFLTDPDAPQQPGRALRFFVKVAMWCPSEK